MIEEFHNITSSQEEKGTKEIKVFETDQTQGCFFFVCLFFTSFCFLQCPDQCFWTFSFHKFAAIWQSLKCCDRVVPIMCPTAGDRLCFVKLPVFAVVAGAAGLDYIIFLLPKQFLKSILIPELANSSALCRRWGDEDFLGLSLHKDKNDKRGGGITHLSHCGFPHLPWS